MILWTESNSFLSNFLLRLFNALLYFLYCLLPLVHLNIRLRSLPCSLFLNLLSLLIFLPVIIIAFLLLSIEVIECISPKSILASLVESTLLLLFSSLYLIASSNLCLYINSISTIFSGIVLAKHITGLHILFIVLGLLNLIIPFS